MTRLRNGRHAASEGLSIGVLSMLTDAIQDHRLTNRQLEGAAALVWAAFLILAALPWVL
jgi:hypothetical protein